jgi:hypothetical protein
MGLLVTLRGDAGNYRIKGAIWELGAASYRAYVHLVPAAARGELAQSVLSVGGPTLQEVLDAAAARVRTTAGTPVENLRVHAALHASAARDAAPGR